jgi:hypothetical protein
MNMIIVRFLFIKQKKAQKLEYEKESKYNNSTKHKYLHIPKSFDEIKNSNNEEKFIINR